MLLTRFNQDSIENFFGAIRSKLGNNLNPSVREMQYLTARLLSMKLITKSHLQDQNCEDDEDLQLDWVCYPDEHEDWNDSTIENCAQLPTNNTQQADQSDICTLGSVGEVVSRRYFDGYLIMKHKFDCELCDDGLSKKEMLQKQQTEPLIYARNFSENVLHLKNPTDMFFNISNVHYRVFAERFAKNAHLTDICKSIMNDCIMETNKHFPEWFAATHNCHSHRISILNNLVVILLRKKARWLLNDTLTTAKYELKEKQGPAARKMRILEK